MANELQGVNVFTVVESVESMKKKIGLVSLGCDKNRVDTENMLYYLKDSVEVVSEYEEADAILINTCAFIESARQESIDAILEMAQYKEMGKCKQLIVTGCLPQKYKGELEESLPEVDAFLGVDEYEKIEAVLNGGAVASRTDNRILTTPAHYAFLRIADGCDNFCTYCTIPSIRGNYRSVPMENLIKQAEKLEKDRVKEVILVAQDVTSYGKDLYGKSCLVALLKELSRFDFKWIRLLYCYPELVSDELIDEIATNPKIAKYVDIPLQHADDGVLKKMNRRSTQAQIKEVLRKLKEKCPSIAVRTTFMVGFPSETQEQFDNLCRFVEQQDFAHVGIFAYSKEEDTPSAKIKGHLSDEVKAERVEILGKICEEKAFAKNRSMIGQTLEVLYEDIDYGRNLFVGRTEQNAPEVDGFVYFSGEFADVGECYKVKITDSDGYDLIGEIVE